jgi:alkanesulfonate monooxygenase SsuD/methylene tetrahydromethanopterin reductase-like flavin-dependent oxidoreductase (luciferase family)
LCFLGGRAVEISDISFGVDIGPFFKVARSFSSAAKVAVEIERLGFDSIWIPDHDVDPLATLSFIAARTSRIRLGTCVLIPDHRNPVLLARQISALDSLSNGRVILGLGAGEGREMFGTPIDRPVARLLETIKILKELWKCTKVAYQGDFWEIRDYSLELKPVQKPHPPIWIGASGPRMLKITAEHGNGCFGPQLTPKHYEEWLGKLRNVTEKVGRNPEEIMPAHLPFTSISKDHETAVKWLEPHVKWFLVWASQPLGLLPQELGYERKWEKEEDVPRGAVERCFVVGTPEECANKIKEFVHSGVRYFVLAIHAPDEKNYFQSLKSYAEQVLPHFKEMT